MTEWKQLVSRFHLHPAMVAVRFFRPMDINQDLDDAMLDRVDEIIHLPCPTRDERSRLARQYFLAYIQHQALADDNGKAPADDSDVPCGTKQNSTALSFTAGNEPPSSITAPEPQRMAEAETHFASTGIRWLEAIHSRLGWIRTSICMVFGIVERYSSGRWGSRERGRAVETAKRRGEGASIRLSDGVRARIERLIRQTAAATQGFYGRDMARFFSALQVLLTENTVM